MRIFLTIIATLWLPLSHAATVYELQPPSWLIRGEQRSPLATGMELRAGDRVVAGENSRIELRFSDDVRLRLGSEGEAVLNDALSPNDLGVVRGSLTLIQGPARIRNDENRHRLRINVGEEALELEGRGDIAFDNDAGIFSACIISGRGNVFPAGEERAALKLSDVGRCYVRDSEKEPREVQLKSAQLKELRDLTGDILRRATLRIGSDWAVRLISSRSEITAAQLMEFVGYAGYPVELNMIGNGEDTRYQPIIHDFMSERGAATVVRELQENFGAKFAKIIQQ